MLSDLMLILESKGCRCTLDRAEMDIGTSYLDIYVNKWLVGIAETRPGQEGISLTDAKSDNMAGIEQSPTDITVPGVEQAAEWVWEIIRAEIALRSYYLWESTGRLDGTDVICWLAAESSLRGREAVDAKPES